METQILLSGKLDDIKSKLFKFCKSEKKYRKVFYQQNDWYQFEINCNVFDDLKKEFGNKMIFLEDIDNIETELKYL